MSAYVVAFNGTPIATATSLADGQKLCQEHVNSMYSATSGMPQLQWRRYLSRGAEFATSHQKAKSPFSDVYAVWTVQTTDGIRLEWAKREINSIITGEDS